MSFPSFPVCPPEKMDGSQALESGEGEAGGW